jgi:hypothetical protein
VWPDPFSFYFLLSRVASSARAYLLVIAKISSDVLGFFMVSLRIKDESLPKKHDNILVVNLWYDVFLVAKMLDKLSEGLSLLLHNAG